LRARHYKMPAKQQALNVSGNFGGHYMIETIDTLKMTNTLSDSLKKFKNLTLEEIKIILDNFSTILLDKQDYFLKEGQICKSVGFIESGLVMYYKLTNEGQELVCDFGSENDWVTQYESLTKKTASTLYIKAIEPTTLNIISFEKINALYKKVPFFENITRQLVEKVFFEILKRAEDFQSLKAEERYEKLLKENPQILNRLPQYYIASYLGIAPQSLSRIRKKY
jgi:CRP/FNR family transcriptional regulator, anaerobic regulatory protein